VLKSIDLSNQEELIKEREIEINKLKEESEKQIELLKEKLNSSELEIEKLKESYEKKLAEYKSTNSKLVEQNEAEINKLKEEFGKKKIYSYNSLNNI
jgi:hypothetical protein